VVFFKKRAKITAPVAFGKSGFVNSSTFYPVDLELKKRVFEKNWVPLNIMDIQFWIWLAVIVITFIVRAKKKNEQAPPPGNPSRRPQQPNFPESTEKPVTFEELLREIQAAKNPKPVQAPQKPLAIPQKSYEVVDYDDNLEEEYTEPKRVDYDVNRDDKVYEIYEQSKRQAFLRPSLEETMKLEDTNVTYSKFDEYKKVEGKKAAVNFLNDFKDPQGLKKAFIMAEILKTKF
jgi:hypothetical protein